MTRSRIRSYGLYLILPFIFSFVSTMAFLGLSYPQTSHAADLNRFDPGYIISDYQMGNYDSMSVNDIQAFLSAHGNCYDTATWKASDGANNPSWFHVRDGHFVCLAEETFGEGVNYGDGVKNGKSAAQIIYDVAHEYRINPQVLIVLLEKEQGLISDSWPNIFQYRIATGYGCPDTGEGCDNQYYGFENQLSWAAHLFRTVLDGGWTNFPLGDNYIGYNPDPGCGGSVVNVRNLATSALYRYTPYQPNAGALAAGYGAGIPCGAYGNRNFYLLFNDWFGDSTKKEPEQAVEAKTNHEQPITSGTYKFRSKASPDKAVDIKGGVTLETTTGSLQLYPEKLSDMDNQIFEIKYDSSDGYYNIINPMTGSAFDVKGASSEDSSPVNIFPLHSNCNQDWLFEENSDGTYKIISRCSSKVLDISMSRNVLQIFTPHGGDNQKWELVKVEDEDPRLSGVYKFRSKASPDKVVDIKGGITPETTTGSLQLYPEKSSSMENQIFEIKYDASDGYYNIINPMTGSAFDIKGAGTDNSSPVNIFPLHSNCNQDWLFEQNSDSTYKIISRCSSKVLDISMSRNVLQIFDNHDGDNQKWELIKIED